MSTDLAEIQRKTEDMHRHGLNVAYRKARKGNTMQITYQAILDRAKDTAKEYMPDFPEENTFEAWSDFQRDVEDLDAMDIAHESSEWDWVIYYGRAMEVCREVPGGVLDQAESEWHDMCGPDSIGDDFGLYEMATQLASIIVTREIVEAVEALKGELLEMAENQMEQFNA